MKLVLSIPPNWRVRADRYCYALERRVTSSGVPARAERAPRWKAEGYYTSCDCALRGLWRIEARAIAAEDIRALAEAYGDAADRICSQVRKAPESTAVAQ